ncbi:hypothetical protein [Luteimonas saliphila]|uniref:hypothetical protein n=1 Tax=Luteimonas saliphila TaxID=2804919 RepID=UPI001EE20651|nr:hypothetical protein [Luteimonas saliphila]
MLIEYVANGSRREVRDSIGEVLIARKIARPVYDTRHVEPELEISPLTGKPKRQYKRRDMKAEE